MNHEFTVNSSWSGIFQRTEEHMALDLLLTARLLHGAPSAPFEQQEQPDKAH